MGIIRLIYFSYTGNVHHFIQKLVRYSVQQSTLRQTPRIISKRITNKKCIFKAKRPFFICVPTYCSQEHEELFTTPVKYYLAYQQNYKRCLGIVGSGDRSYQNYCWTAHLYAKTFSIPVVDDFELRGTKYDIQRIYETLINIES